MVAPLLERVRSPAVGVIWDIGNTYAAGEDPPEGARLLGERIAYLHIKDGAGRGAAWRLTSIGQGEVPLKQVLALLRGRGQAAALNVEWERAWHPELDPPEIALPAAIGVIRELLSHPRADERRKTNDEGELASFSSGSLSFVLRLSSFVR